MKLVSKIFLILFLFGYSELVVAQSYKRMVPEGIGMDRPRKIGDLGYRLYNESWLLQFLRQLRKACCLCDRV